MMVSDWIRTNKEHVECLRYDPILRDHMLSHEFDPDPDRIGITIGDIDLDTLYTMHSYDHETMCACGRKLVMAQVQDFHQKAGSRLLMVCPVSYVLPERCGYSRNALGRLHGT